MSEYTDTLMAAAAEVEEWRREFIETETLPIVRQAARMQWARLTPEQKELLKRTQPEMYEQIVQYIKE